MNLKNIEHKGYWAELRYDENNKIIVGKVMGIFNSIVFDGESLEEIERIFHEVIDDYILLREELGWN